MFSFSRRRWSLSDAGTGNEYPIATTTPKERKHDNRRIRIAVGVNLNFIMLPFVGLKMMRLPNSFFIITSLRRYISTHAATTKCVFLMVYRGTGAAHPVNFVDRALNT